jgi:peroxiredoxin
MKRHLGSLVATVLVLGAAVWLLWPAQRTVPSVTFTLTDGTQLATGDLRGQPLLVNFWSVSCDICLRDMPKLTRLATTLDERGLHVIGVAMHYDPPPAVIGVVERIGPGFPIALDVHGEAARAFGGVDATPTTFLLDRDGGVALHTQGPLDETRIRATFLTL